MDITFVELWKIATDGFYRELNVTNRSFILFGRKQRDNNEGKEQFFGALSDLA